MPVQGGGGRGAGVALEGAGSGGERGLSPVQLGLPALAGTGVGEGAGPSPVSPVPKGATKQRASVPRAAIRDAVLALLVEALEAVEGESLDVELTLRPARDKAGSAS